MLCRPTHDDRRDVTHPAQRAIFTATCTTVSSIASQRGLGSLCGHELAVLVLVRPPCRRQALLQSMLLASSRRTAPRCSQADQSIDRALGGRPWHRKTTWAPSSGTSMQRPQSRLAGRPPRSSAARLYPEHSLHRDHVPGWIVFDVARNAYCRIRGRRIGTSTRPLHEEADGQNLGVPRWPRHGVGGCPPRQSLQRASLASNRAAHQLDEQGDDPNGEQSA